MDDSAVYLILGIAFLLVGGFFFWNARRLEREAAASVGWPHVDGQITRSEISSQDGEHLFSVRYAYAVQDVAREGSVVSYGPSVGGMQVTAALQQKYPVGKAVHVYYNPTKPATSVLEPGATRRPMYSVIWVLVAAGVICLGLWFLKQRM